MRSRAAIGAACVLALTVAACGSKSTAARVTRAPADLTDGFAEITVPLPTRQMPMVVAAGDHVVVFGGYRVEGSRYLPRGDGADYDIARGEWTAMPPAPFARPLHLAAGVWTGREVIVVGTPCGDTALPDEIYDAQCDHATIAAAAYSPGTHSWRSLAGPDPESMPGLEYGTPLLGSGVGSTGRSVLFANDTGDRSHALLVTDNGGSAWRFLPAFPTADAVCPVAGAIVAVETGEIDASGGSGMANPQTLAAPLRTSTLDAASGAWVASVALPKPASTGAMFERVICSAGQLAYFPIFPGPIGFDGGGLWYEPASHRWTALPGFGPTNSPDIRSVAEIHGTKVVSLGGSLFVLPAGATSWAHRPLLATAVGRFDVTDDLILVRGYDDDTKPLTIGLLDPERYVNASDGTLK